MERGEQVLLGKRLKRLRKDKKLTQEQLGRKINVTKVSISGYENGNRSPDTETLQKIADFFDVTTDYLLGRSDNPVLTAKDEKDIAKKLENILNSMDSDTALAFDGEPMDEETKELVKAAIKSNLELTKQLAKRKFTPKKYRRDKE